MRIWHVLALLGLLILGAPALSEQVQRSIYQCTHQDGRVEFTGQPAPGLACILVERRLVDVTPVPATPNVAETERHPVPQTDQDLRRQNCEIARENLAVLSGNRDVAVVGPEGEPTLLTSEQRMTELRSARREVDYWCDLR